MSGMMTNDPLSVLKTLEASRIKPETRMQCKVCGFVYDPAEGCEEWQVPPGTPFAEIPDNYDCPACGCPHHSFIVLDEARLLPRLPHGLPALWRMIRFRKRFL